MNRRPSLKSGRPLVRPVTVIVLTWNAVKETAAMLSSWFRHPLPRNADLLFLDNGSEDYTVDLLYRHEEVEVVLNQDNLGFTRAANIGITMAGDRDVVLLNNDTRVVQGDWLHRLQATAYGDDKIGVVGCRLISPEGRVMHAGGVLDPVTGDGGNILCRLDERRSVIDCTFVTFGCVYIKRSTVEAVGLLDERFFAYCEDTDYCLRTRQAGLRVVMDGRVNMVHIEGGSSKDRGIDRSPLLRDSSLKFYEKWKGQIGHLCIT